MITQYTVRSLRRGKDFHEAEEEAAGVGGEREVTEEITEEENK